LPRNARFGTETGQQAGRQAGRPVCDVYRRRYSADITQRVRAPAALHCTAPRPLRTGEQLMEKHAVSARLGNPTHQRGLAMPMGRDTDTVGFGLAA
jgi:hypothetical protein